MREKLKAINGLRAEFEGTFQRFGEKPGFRGKPPKRTLILLNVSRAGDPEILCDHLWFVCGKQFDRLGLVAGDRVRFRATVSSYRKGYRGRRDDDDLPPPSRDYRLSYPSNMRKLTRQEQGLDPVQPALFAGSLL